MGAIMGETTEKRPLTETAGCKESNDFTVL